MHHDLPRLMSHYAAEAVAVSPVFGEVRGRAAIAATWERLFSTFTDIQYSVSDLLVDGNRIAVLGSVTVTDRVGWFGLPPTGGLLSYRLVLLFTIVEGEVVHDERIYDSTGVVERLQKARLDKELQTASEVQRALLSRTEYRTPFCESAGDSVPCRAIGGDFFEFAELATGEVAFAMGDVAGKGPAAALLASMLQGMLAVEAGAGLGPAEMLSRLNQRLCERRLDARFTTLVYCVLSPGGKLVYANAGHNPPALLTRSGIRQLRPGGLVLGAFADSSYTEDTLQLETGDTIVLFTDGVTEACNRAGEEFGEARILGCIRAAGGTPQAILDNIFAAVREFRDGSELSDDITVTVTRYDQGNSH